ncbi:MAG: nucleoside monophosphate kinase [Candidatus Colwellbacteria bacterium]|nr:nucleoside monophosphate kinase [Candidatus Colwellbacteria bacterium]
MGPPGSGKGTQAEFIANHIRAVWYDTGTKIREHLASDEMFSEEAEDYKAGKIVNPNKVLKMVLDDIKGVFASQKSIVLSSSPRSLTEAFGSGEGGLMHLLHDTYGRNNILVFHIFIPIEESIKRNTKRKDGRIDDLPEVIKARYEDQYIKSVVPTIEAMETDGYNIIDIDGMPSPEEIFEGIKKYL